MKKYLWIVNFQHKSSLGIRALSLCVEAEGIQSALIRANRIIASAELGEFGIRKITDIGIADENSRVWLGKIFTDPINDPDPDLFQEGACR